MMEPSLVIATTFLVGLCVIALAMLRAWQDWIELKRQELDRNVQSPVAEIEGGAGMGAARIEMADLKERIKKLEAIASGVEL